MDFEFENFLLEETLEREREEKEVQEFLIIFEQPIINTF